MWKNRISSFRILKSRNRGNCSTKRLSSTALFVFARNYEILTLANFQNSQPNFKKACFLFQAGHVCGDMRDLIDGKPTGAVRASFGYMTRKADVDMLVRLVYDCWVRPFQVRKVKVSIILSS